MSNLDERVAEAFENASENGYFFGSAEEMALDMISCDASLEDESAEDVQASLIRQGYFS